jgi:predicted nucleic acid-binding protein
MPADRRRVYWDACVFINYIEGTASCIDVLNSLVEEARDQELILVTSTLSMAEVAYAESERTGGLLDPLAFQAIDDMWEDRSILLLAEFSTVFALGAREIIPRGKNEGRSLRTADAIHLATARSLDAKDFHTFDAKLHRWNDEWFPVREPVSERPMLPGMSS